MNKELKKENKEKKKKSGRTCELCDGVWCAVASLVGGGELGWQRVLEQRVELWTAKTLFDLGILSFVLFLFKKKKGGRSGGFASTMGFGDFGIPATPGSLRRGESIWRSSKTTRTPWRRHRLRDNMALDSFVVLYSEKSLVSCVMLC